MDTNGEGTLKDIKLVSIYRSSTSILESYMRILYNLLAERTPDESISHKKMPEYEEHVRFIIGYPYKSWYLIQSWNEPELPFVGGIYINYDNSIGIGIFNKYKRQSYASAAIRALMDFHKEPYYFANINPKNLKSKELFKRLGFKHTEDLRETKSPHAVIQEVYTINCAAV